MRKNVKFLICLVVAGLAFASCEKDEENGGGGSRTITATVENGASYNAEIDSVYAIFTWEYINDEGYDDYEYVVIAKAPYNNGGFSITLPETVDDKYLNAISDGVYIGPLTFSDNTVKSLTIANFDAVKNGERVAIYRSNIDQNKVDIYDLERDELISLYANGVYIVHYMYVNKPLTITGSFVDDEYFDDIELQTNVNCSLQKGWNTVVVETTLSVSVTGEVTGTQNYSSNSEPAGLKWYCSPHYDY